MNASLRTLLSGVIDYGGLFPPAKLPLDQAIRNYARYRQDPDAWMLGRFIIPASRLSELHAYADFLQEGPPFAFSVLGPSEAGWWEYRDGLEEALSHVKEFRERCGGRGVADVLETKMPADLVSTSDPKATAGRLNDIGATIERAGFSDLSAFFECGSNAGESAIAAVLEAIAISNRGSLSRAGFKLRCGGLEASAFPTAEQVAFVIRHAARNRVALKFTAGLHHPIRRFDASVKTQMHGFVNVLAAGVLVLARPSASGTLVPVITDDDPKHFAFTDDGLSWKEMHASMAAIAVARRAFVTSFGSCSFDEPRDDLRVLGWL